MPDHKHAQVIALRYSSRRKAEKPGWASDLSYRRKAETFDKLVELYNIPQGARILELGCGAGNTTVHMAQRGFRACGMDIIPEAINWAKDKAIKQQVPVDFYIGSITELSPFGDNFFDLIFDGDCLWMILGKDRSKCFANIFRILKPAGVLFAQAHLADPRFTKPCDFAPGACFDPNTGITTVKGFPMYQLSTKISFQREIEKAGFVILKDGLIEMENKNETDKDSEVAFLSESIFVEARKALELMKK